MILEPVLEGERGVSEVDHGGRWWAWRLEGVPDGSGSLTGSARVGDGHLGGVWWVGFVVVRGDEEEDIVEWEKN
jgi:hypothetical protein